MNVTRERKKASRLNKFLPYKIQSLYGLNTFATEEFQIGHTFMKLGTMKN